MPNLGCTYVKNFCSTVLKFKYKAKYVDIKYNRWSFLCWKRLYLSQLREKFSQNAM